MNIYVELFFRSFLKNGQNYIQFVSKRNQFSSIEGQYTFKTSDSKYHSITYEVPLDDLDHNGVVIRENEISSEDTFFKTGTLRLQFNGTNIDVKYFMNKNGFHVQDFVRPDQARQNVPQTPTVRLVPTNRTLRNQRRINQRGIVNNRISNPSLIRGASLTGLKPVQPGKK